jgi:glycosyltransferase involved in cell wall biosynthesis
MGIQMERSIPFLRRHGVEASILTSFVPGLPRSSHGVDGEHVTRSLTFSRGEGGAVREHFRSHACDYDLVHAILLDWEFLLNISYLERRGLPVIVEMVLLDGDNPLSQSREQFGGLKLRLVSRVDAWIGIAAAFPPRMAAVGIPEERFRLINPGVDVAHYRPGSREERSALRKSLALPADACIAVTIGSVNRRKGMDRVLRAWARIRPEEGRDLLLIIGPASLEEGLPASEIPHVEQLRRPACKAGIGGTVRFLGRVDNAHAEPA